MSRAHPAANGRRPPAIRAQLIRQGPGLLRVEGALDFSTVRRLLAEGKSLLSGAPEIEIDLGGVESANSAGLALLLEWLDLARARGVALHYRNLPESLARIAELSNLGSLLPCRPEANPEANLATANPSCAADSPPTVG